MEAIRKKSRDSVIMYERESGVKGEGGRDVENITDALGTYVVVGREY